MHLRAITEIIILEFKDVVKDNPMCGHVSKCELYVNAILESIHQILVTDN